MEYQVKAYGEVQVAYRGQKAAIDHAKIYPAEADAKVIAHEVSGTYQSHTCIWPVRGETYSN